MSWAQAAWLNNKIRIPDSGKMLVGNEDCVIFTTPSPSTMTIKSVSFTPKYSGTVIIIDTASEATQNYKNVLQSVSLNGTDLPLNQYKYEEITSLLVRTYYLISVTGGSTYTLTLGSSSRVLKGSVQICGVVAEKTLNT